MALDLCDVCGQPADSHDRRAEDGCRFLARYDGKTEFYSGIRSGSLVVVTAQHLTRDYIIASAQSATDPGAHLTIRMADVHPIPCALTLDGHGCEVCDQTEDEVATAAGHPDACGYTLKATTEERLDHYLTRQPDCGSFAAEEV